MLVSICRQWYLRIPGRNLNALILWVANLYDISSYHACAWSANDDLSSLLLHSRDKQQRQIHLNFGRDFIKLLSNEQSIISEYMERENDIAIYMLLKIKSLLSLWQFIVCEILLF